MKTNTNSTFKFRNPVSLSLPKLAIFAAIFAAIGGWFIFQSFAATPATDPNAASLSMVPNTKVVATGGTVKVQIRANSGATLVNAVRADFTYPADKLQFVEFEQVYSPFDVGVESTGGSGKVEISRSTLSENSGDVPVATVIFKALVPIDDTAAGLQFTDGIALLDVFGANNILAADYATRIPTPSLYLKTEQSSVLRGSPYVVNVYMNNGYHDINTLRVELAYSSSLLGFSRIEFPPNNSFLTVRENVNDPVNGYYTFELGAVSPQSEYRRDYLVARMYFNTKAAGTSNMIFRKGSKLVNYPHDRNVLFSARGTTLTINNLSKTRPPTTSIGQ